MNAKAHVLVIDDDAVVGRSFDRVLSGKGYEVDTALTGEEALREIDHEHYDVVFTDRGVLRVAARVCGVPVDRTNQLSDGFIEVARLVGIGDRARRANLGLVELARSVCVPDRPKCSECPLQGECLFAADTIGARQGSLLGET